MTTVQLNVIERAAVRRGLQDLDAIRVQLTTIRDNGYASTGELTRLIEAKNSVDSAIATVLRTISRLQK